MSLLHTFVASPNGEAEYYELVRGACTSLGIQSHDQGWMMDVPIGNYSDSSAARSVARRRGIDIVESNGSWSFEVGCCCRQANSSSHTHDKRCQVAGFASGQNMLVRSGCSSHCDEATATANLRSIVMLTNERTMTGRMSSGQGRKRSVHVWCRWKSWRFLDSRTVEQVCGQEVWNESVSISALEVLKRMF